MDLLKVIGMGFILLALASATIVAFTMIVTVVSVIFSVGFFIGLSWFILKMIQHEEGIDGEADKPP